MFKCKNSGICCKERSGYSTLLFPSDIFRISKDKLKGNQLEFIHKYCNIIEFLWDTSSVKFAALKHMNQECIFLQNNVCTVHNIKPIVCRLGPIISPLFSPSKGFDDWHLLNCKGAISSKKNEVINQFKINNSILNGHYHRYYFLYNSSKGDVNKIINHIKNCNANITQKEKNNDTNNSTYTSSKTAAAYTTTKIVYFKKD
ncbi:YkgJ family cysteine cluster protein [Thermodesulfobacteriota bacterium]